MRRIFGRLLDRAGIPAPYILVGHSLGGYDVRMFADLYPASVFGLLLIDPATERTTSILDTISSVTASDKADTERREMCQRLAERGQFESKSWSRCVESDPRYDADMIAGRQFTKRRPGYWLTVNSEYVSGPANEASLLAVPMGFASKPLLVLTASNTWTANNLETSADKAAQLRQTRLQAHQEIASESSLGTDCIIENTSHFIQIDRPFVVISAVERILNTKGMTQPACPESVGNQR